MTLCEDHPYLVLEHSPQKETHAQLSVTPQSPDPIPNNLYCLLYFLSLDLHVLDISQKSVTCYAALCFRLLSLSMVFSGFGHSVECFGASFLFTAG